MQYYYNLLDGRVVGLYYALASCMSNECAHSLKGIKLPRKGFIYVRSAMGKVL